MKGRIPKVVVAGSAYVDMAIKCDQLPQPGETAEGSGFSYTPTGPGVNRAVGSALCGCESYLISKVGDDLFGEIVKENLTKNNVNTEFVYTAQAMSTGIIVTMVDAMGENGSCISAGANRALSSDEVACAAAEQLIGSADVCLIHGDLPQDVIVTAIRMAGLYKTKVILEINVPVHDIAQLNDLDWPMEYYSANVLVPDFHNCSTPVESVAGNMHNLKFIGSELVARGVGCVVMKTGARGALVIDNQGTEHIDAFDVELVDHTCCADAFAGALAASCGAGDAPKDAVKFAAAAGALACTKFGSQDALPKKQEIIELLQKYPD